MNVFTISLDDLSAGWAYLTISDDKQDTRGVDMTVSYILYDSLEKFVEAAINLAHKENSVISCFLEPTIMKWKVEYIQGDYFNLYIEDLIFHDTVKRFIRQVLNMFDKYIFEYSEAEYEKQWRHNFPSKKLDQLRELLHKI